MEISLTFLHQIALVRLFPVWKNLHLTAKNAMSRLLKPACHHQLLHLLNRREAEAPQELAWLDLRFFQNNPKNEGCTECFHLFLLLSDVAVAGLKTNKPWWFIYAPLKNSLLTCPYLQSLGQRQRPVEGKLSSARSVITRLLNSSEPDPSLPLRRCLLIVQDWKWGKNDTKIIRWSCFSSAARRLRPIWAQREAHVQQVRLLIVINGFLFLFLLFSTMSQLFLLTSLTAQPWLGPSGMDTHQRSSRWMI